MRYEGGYAERRRRLPEKNPVLVGPGRRENEGDPRTYLAPDAPFGFTIHAQLNNDDDGPWLWIGEAGDERVRRFYGVIGGETLRQLAVEVLARYPSNQRG